ncbi:MAG TPA: aromatic amino acid lyase [Actinomycetales bacterium]|nr:aromatic amino acid lyase [Actinomycetales bacterium]
MESSKGVPRPRPVLVLDGRSLTCADVVAAAHGRRQVELADGVLERVSAAHERSVELGASRHVYGRTTGVGANKDVTVGDPGSAHVLALLRSHATTSGRRRSDERVRGTLVVRLHQLAAGASGVSAEVVEALLGMVAADALPVVRELGSVGTGDLAPLAAAALTLSGETVTSPPVPRTVAFTVHDALPFLSSSAATVADSALAQQQLDRLARAAVVVAALTCTAVGGNPEAFSEPVEARSPFAGARQVCRWLRSLVDTSLPGLRLQDPYGLRTLPQVHGTLVDALDHLAAVIEGVANHPAENPMVVVHDGAVDPARDIPHNGAFALAPLATALDTARSAVVQAAQLSLTRLTLLDDPAFTGLPPFLSDGTAGSSGVMPVEYVAASALAQLRLVATPVATQTVVLSRGAEDDASFASTGALAALDAVGGVRAVLACELVAAVRALRMQRSADPPRTPVPPSLQRVLDSCRSLPDDVSDRDLTGDLDVAAGLLDGLAGLLPPAGRVDAR